MWWNCWWPLARLDQIPEAGDYLTLDVLGQPGVYDRLRRIGSRLRHGLVEAGERHGFAVQAPGSLPR